MLGKGDFVLHEPDWFAKFIYSSSYQGSRDEKYYPVVNPERPFERDAIPRGVVGVELYCEQVGRVLVDGRWFSLRGEDRVKMRNIFFSASIISVGRVQDLHGSLHAFDSERDTIHYLA